MLFYQVIECPSFTKLLRAFVHQITTYCTLHNMATTIKNLFVKRRDSLEPLLPTNDNVLSEADRQLMRHRPVRHDEGSACSSETQHSERHFESPRIISDCIIGFSDGLCVPFALVSGLASLDSSKIVVLAGFAELVSGAISMGLGGYLASKSEHDHYKSERYREQLEVMHDPEEEERECLEIFAPYGISAEAVKPMIQELRKNPELWVDFMVKFELGLEAPNVRTACFSGMTIGVSYFIGGLVPLLPYLLISSTLHALYASIGVTALVLLVFGWVKSAVMIKSRSLACFSALQTLLIGAIAAGSAFGLVRLLDSQST